MNFLPTDSLKFNEKYWHWLRRSEAAKVLCLNLKKILNHLIVSVSIVISFYGVIFLLRLKVCFHIDSKSILKYYFNAETKGKR